MSAVLIDVWSDFVCPFCYLAEPALDRVAREQADSVQITWRAFELRPDPEPLLDPAGDYLRDIWSESVQPMAAERGMTLRLPPVQPRSRLAHLAAAYARQQGRAAAMHTAIFRAFFERGENIGQVAVLIRLATEIGLDPCQFAEALSAGECLHLALEDEETAHELGISGVPAMVVRRAGDGFERAILVEGAQSYEVIMDAVGRVARGEASLPEPPAE
ncbi:MAG: DsbA family oxidoreductase [Opitutae bacterium]|nr:DsbA family oxidoreductase [Opitutae bacterium]